MRAQGIDRGIGHDRRQVVPTAWRPPEPATESHSALLLRDLLRCRQRLGPSRVGLELTHRADLAAARAAHRVATSITRTRTLLRGHEERATTGLAREHLVDHT